ncbi:hypothetical protein ACLK1Z_19610 [Escherichia coli]
MSVLKHTEPKRRRAIMVRLLFYCSPCDAGVPVCGREILAFLACGRTRLHFWRHHSVSDRH